MEDEETKSARVYVASNPGVRLIWRLGTKLVVDDNSSSKLSVVGVLIDKNPRTTVTPEQTLAIKNAVLALRKVDVSYDRSGDNDWVKRMREGGKDAQWIEENKFFESEWSHQCFLLYSLDLWHRPV